MQLSTASTELSLSISDASNQILSYMHNTIRQMSMNQTVAII